MPVRPHEPIKPMRRLVEFTTTRCQSIAGRRLTKHAPHSMCRVYGKWSKTAKRVRSCVRDNPLPGSPSGPREALSSIAAGLQLMYNTVA
jgi:hypothetical protein